MIAEVDEILNDKALTHDLKAVSDVIGFIIEKENLK